MNICIYNVTSTCSIGGNETFSIRLGEFLKKRGNDVCLVGGTPKEKDIQPSTVLDVKTFDYIEVDRIIDLGTRFRKFAQRMLFASKAVSFIKKSNFDVVHIFKPYDFITAYILKKIGVRAKIVARFGGLEFFMGDGVFAKSIDHIYSNSVVTAQKVSYRYNVPPIVIRNGIDTHLFKKVKIEPDLKKRFGIEDNETVILFVGRLVGWKGIDKLIHAFRKVCLSEGGQKIKLLIVGDGDCKERWKNLAGDLNIKNKIIFTGAVDYKELPSYYSISDMYVQPSIGEESCPNSVFEAMSSSLPVIATDNGGTKEIIKDGETGYLVKTGDINEMAEKIESLLNADIRRTMGEKGRFLIENEYSMERIVNNFLEMIGSR